MTVGERIKNRRIELRMSQEELAMRVGCKSKSSVCKMETKDNNPTMDTVKLYAKALETTPAYLMGWEVEDAPVPDTRIEGLTPHEWDVVLAYRKSVHQKAIDDLLHVPEKKDSDSFKVGKEA